MVMGYGSERGSFVCPANTARKTACPRWTATSAASRAARCTPRHWTTVGQYGGFQPRWDSAHCSPGAAVQYPRSGVTSTFAAMRQAAGKPQPTSSTRLILREGGTPAFQPITSSRTPQPAPARRDRYDRCIPGSILHKSNTREQTDCAHRSRRRHQHGRTLQPHRETQPGRSMLYSNRNSQRLVAGYPMQAGSFGTPMSAQSYFNRPGQRSPIGGGGRGKCLGFPVPA